MVFTATCCLLVEILRSHRWHVSVSVRWNCFCPPKWIGVVDSSWSNLCLSSSSSLPFYYTVSCFITMIIGQKICTNKSRGWQSLDVVPKHSGKNLQDPFSWRSVNGGDGHMQLIFMFYWMGRWIIERLCVPAGPLFWRRTKQCGGNKNPDTLKTRGMTLHTPLDSHSFVTSHKHTHRWIQACLLGHMRITSCGYRQQMDGLRSMLILEDFPWF